MAEGGQHVQGSEHAGVSAPEVSKVIVTRVFATEHRIMLGHSRLDVGVADLGHHGSSPHPGHRFGDGTRSNAVVHHAHLLGRHAPRNLILDLSRGHQGGDRTGRDRSAPLVHHEAPIGIPVEGQAHVCAVSQHCRLKVDDVGRVQRVGFVMREGSVEIEIEPDHFQGRAHRPQNGGCAQPCHPVAGVDHDPQGADAA